LNDDSSLAEQVRSQPATSGFAESWAPVGTRFPRLIQFCGGLATVFPGTSSVESDFSVINWEYDEFRCSLTELSLEGIMQCKQFKKLEGLTHGSALPDL
jgi:hypothetical protein